MDSVREGLSLKSEESKNSSEQETAFSIYVKTGLSAEEVARKLQQYGPNDIPEKKASPFRKFLGYFWGPIPWMIEIASILSIIIQHYDDFAIIFTLLIVNAVVGFWQERKADNAIELLKKRLAPFFVHVGIITAVVLASRLDIKG